MSCSRELLSIGPGQGGGPGPGPGSAAAAGREGLLCGRSAPPRRPAPPAAASPAARPPASRTRRRRRARPARERAPGAPPHAARSSCCGGLQRAWPGNPPPGLALPFGLHAVPAAPPGGAACCKAQSGAGTVSRIPSLEPTASCRLGARNGPPPPTRFNSWKPQFSPMRGCPWDHATTPTPC